MQKDITELYTSSSALAPATPGVITSTPLWLGQGWFRADHAILRRGRCKPTETPDAESSAHGAPIRFRPVPTWKYLTETGRSLHLSAHQPLMARPGGGAGSIGWHRAADLVQGDEIASLIGPLPDSIQDTTVEDLATTSYEKVEWSDTEEELAAYAFGVTFNSPASKRYRRNKVEETVDLRLLDPFWLARSEPTICDRIAQWAETFGIASGDSHEAIANRIETIRVAGKARQAPMPSPRDLLKGPDRVKAAFLQGVFDMAAVPIREGMYVPLSTYRNGSILQTLLLQPFGISCTSTMVKHRGAERPSIVLTMPWAKRFAEVVGFHVARKQAQVETWSEGPCQPDHRMTGPFMFERIISIECRGRQPLVNLGQRWSGLMIAHGFLTFAGDLA